MKGFYKCEWKIIFFWDQNILHFIPPGGVMCQELQVIWTVIQKTLKFGTILEPLPLLPNKQV